MRKDKKHQRTGKPIESERTVPDTSALGLIGAQSKMKGK